ncbi:MAG TPA: hypothetical protein VIO11_03550 [Candidatus Methanoperedens sp.]
MKIKQKLKDIGLFIGTVLGYILILTGIVMAFLILRTFLGS